MISPLAYIHPNAQLGANVTVAPFAFIDDDVVIGDNCIIDSNAVICSHVRMGSNNHVFPQATIGAIPQDLKFKEELTYTIIGDNNTFRECCTVHRGTASKGKTLVGSYNLIMAYSHVAHDVVIADHCILSNATQLAGEVLVDEYAILGGGTLVHQFTHIGAHVMLEGGSRVTKDVPPFALAGREPLTYYGINRVGLERRGFTSEQLATIKEVYRYIYASHLNVSQALQTIEREMPASPERDLIIEFVKSSSRGIIKGLS